MAFPTVSTNNNGDAAAAFQSAAQGAGLDVTHLSAIAQLQAAVANLYASLPTALVVPAAQVKDGATAGATGGTFTTITGITVAHGIVTAISGS